MTQSEFLVAPLRVLAVCVSVGVGGFLVWSTQQAHGGDSAGKAEAESQSQRKVVEVPEDAQEGSAIPEPDRRKVFLPSSKNAFSGGQLFPELQPGEVIVEERQTAPFLSSSKRMVMPGELPATWVSSESKSGKVLTCEEWDAVLSLVEELEVQPFLYSSKSAPLHLIDWSESAPMGGGAEASGSGQGLPPNESEDGADSR